MIRPLSFYTVPASKRFFSCIFEHLLHIKKPIVSVLEVHSDKLRTTVLSDDSAW